MAQFAAAGLSTRSRHNLDALTGIGGAGYAGSEPHYLLITRQQAAIIPRS